MPSINARTAIPTLHSFLEVMSAVGMYTAPSNSKIQVRHAGKSRAEWMEAVFILLGYMEMVQKESQ